MDRPQLEQEYEEITLASTTEMSASYPDKTKADGLWTEMKIHAEHLAKAGPWLVTYQRGNEVLRFRVADIVGLWERITADFEEYGGADQGDRFTATAVRA